MRLGPKQIDLLKKVVASNGGGVSGYSVNLKTMRSLEKKGLIQGKLGQPYMIVHTKMGLEILKAMKDGV